MSPSIHGADLDAFRGYVTRRLGLACGDDKLPELARILERRIREAGTGDVPAYLARLESGRDGEAEMAALAESLTVGESYFFRNADQLEALRDHVLPELERMAGPDRPLEILSAGCSAGQEPYSLAMVLAERHGEVATGRARILGVDLNPRALDQARDALYTDWSLRQTPPAAVERHFIREGDKYRVNPRIRAAVGLEQHNLVEDDPALWAEGSWDLIFCRNVIMYFPADTARRVVDRMARSLREGGYLFLGHAETMRGLSEAFSLQQTHGTFYYRRRGDLGEGGAGAMRDTRAGGSAPALPPPQEQVQAPAPLRASARPLPEDWWTVIDGAHRRLASLAMRDTRTRATRDTAPAADPRDRISTDETPHAPARATDPEELLLQAVVLADGGRLDEADRLLDAVLAADEFNPGAHYLRGLCAEHLGRPEEAERSYRSASYLDPGFAMPALQLGRLARRLGDPAGATRELERAADLFLREDSARILLFGGGLGRRVLADLCRRELEALGACPNIREDRTGGAA